ncbi:beta-lactamase family protein [Streptomyces sp. A7024]|uniref:Beta-lactamase family protein n=1 Tax=Streptomyces coryli TaxID=1128680 RepID=A0A6G4TRL1_9ACTN|nr:serine hydrolase domain-containing protein [Streptomyces coryli]NGN62423.1 beta-lactamase family protein [Streptomyces coryli]
MTDATSTMTQKLAAAAGPHPAAIVAQFRNSGDGAETYETASLGFAETGHAVPLTDTTHCEVGSVSKTYTALMLAVLCVRGALTLDDRVDRYLPMRQRGADRMTLRHLATHTSGLPFHPPGLRRRAIRSWNVNPYATFDAGDVLPALTRTRLRSQPGSRQQYSNFGVGLLGRIMEMATGGTYARLLDDLVVRPLGLADTTADPCTPQATGHWRGRTRPPAALPGLPGAGVVRSSARGLIRHMRCLMNPDACTDDPELRKALGLVLRPDGPDARTPPLIWNRRTTATGRTVHYHGGGTRGFTAFIGFSIEPGLAYAALTNNNPDRRNAFVNHAYAHLHQQIEAAPSRRG